MFGHGLFIALARQKVAVFLLVGRDDQRILTPALMEIAPSPRPSGEQGRGEGFILENIGLLTPPLFSLSEEREKNGGGFKLRPIK